MTLYCGKCDTEAQGSPDNLPDGWETHTIGTTATEMQICGSCAARTTTSSKSTGNVAADQLRLLIERIERIEEEEKGLKDDKKDVYLEGKATGYDVKIMREIVRLRKMNPHDLAERDAILETYRSALGME